MPSEAPDLHSRPHNSPSPPLAPEVSSNHRAVDDDGSRQSNTAPRPPAAGHSASAGPDLTQTPVPDPPLKTPHTALAAHLRTTPASPPPARGAPLAYTPL